MLKELGHGFSNFEVFNMMLFKRGIHSFRFEFSRLFKACKYYSKITFKDDDKK